MIKKSKHLTDIHTPVIIKSPSKENTEIGMSRLKTKNKVAISLCRLRKGENLFLPR